MTRVLKPLSLGAPPGTPVLYFDGRQAHATRTCSHVCAWHHIEGATVTTEQLVYLEGWLGMYPIEKCWELERAREALGLAPEVTP